MADGRSRRGSYTMTTVLAVVVFGASVLADSAAAQTHVDPRKLTFVRGLVADLGPRGAIDRLAADSASFYAFLGGVAEARGEWLDVGAQLVGVADGYASDLLVAAFSRALERRPDAILSRGYSGIPLSAVCGYDPFSPISSMRTRKQFLAALEPRERAVRGVNRPELVAVKSACLATLEQLKTSAPARYTP